MGVGRELSTRVATEVGAVVDSARGVALAVAAALADLCTEDRKSDIHVSAFLRAAAASVLLPCMCTAWSLYLLTCSLQAHRVNERCDLEDDNRSHDELDDTGDEEQHAGL